MASSSAARAVLVEQVEDYLDSISTFITSDDLSIERDEREQARQDIDDALSRLGTSFRRMQSALLRERNSAVLAAAIPPEILAEIFGYGGVQAAILAMNVCHRWRVAVLSHPSLWSKVNMKSPRYSEKLLLLQLAHSGSCPLEITFSISVWGDSVKNPQLPPNQIGIVKMASLISDISTQTLYPYLPEGLPLLQSLHLVVDRDTPDEDLICKLSNLRHLSIDFITLGRMTLAMQTLRNLRTLHVTRLRETAITILRAVLTIGQLEELLIESCKDAEDVSDEVLKAEFQRSRFSPPKLLCIRKVSLPFLTCFLSPGMVGPTTNLQIEPRPPMPFSRNLAATACWIDLQRQYTLYQHGDNGVLTHLAVGDSYVDGSNEIPASVPLQGVTSLYWVGGNITNPPFYGLPSLISLSFEFYPSRVGELRVGLGDILGDLAYYCPRLEYLAISIRRPKPVSTLIQRDNADDAIAAFLESWTDLYGEVFSHVEIYDEYRPLRWEPVMPVMSFCAWSFEVKEQCMLEDVILPSIPPLRRFVVEEEDAEPRPFRGFAQTFR